MLAIRTRTNWAQHSSLMRAKSSLLHRFLWECPSEQRSITCHNYVLPAIKCIRDWGVSHISNGGMPEGCTVAGSQGHDTADGIASED